jgi:hypothetical protein
LELDPRVVDPRLLLVAFFLARRPEARACEFDLEDDFRADLGPLRLRLFELDDREDFNDARPLFEALFTADRAVEAARLMAFLPLRWPVALAASAPTTPPTIVPIGPTVLPTTAPATAPAVSRGIEGS